MNKRMATWAVVFLGATGCFMIQGRAEMVKRDKAGGVLALKGDRDKAMEDLEEARTLYERLIPECGDDPLLKQEALFGAAQAEEALVGVPKDGNTETSLGSLDKAAKLYGQLAKEAPDSFLGKQAAARAKQLEENKADVQKFYTELNKFAASAK